MSLPNTILSFGDFNEGNEVGSLNHLLTSLGKPITNKNLELPWSEGDHLKDINQECLSLAASGISFGTVDLKGENFNFTVGRSSLNSSIQNTAVEFDDKVFRQSQSDEKNKKPRRNKKKRDDKYYEDFYKNQEFSQVDESKKETTTNQRVNEQLNTLQNETKQNCMKNADVINTATAGNRTINHEQSCMPDLIPNLVPMQGNQNVDQKQTASTNKQKKHIESTEQQTSSVAFEMKDSEQLSNNAILNDNNKINKENISCSEIELQQVIDKTEVVIDQNNIESNEATLIETLPQKPDFSPLKPVSSLPQPVESLQQPDTSVQQPATSPQQPIVSLQPDAIPQQPVSPQQPVARKPSSWAGLFSKPDTKDTAAPVDSKVQSVPEPVVENQVVVNVDDRKPVSVDFDSYAKQLGDLLSKVQLNHRSVAWQPRGLNNKANWCYINSILQALLFCPPFGNLIKSIPVHVKERLPTSTPMLDCIIDFVNMYEVMPHRVSGKRVTDIQTGCAFEPVQVYQMLSRAKTSFSVEGRQEDAEEFLGCLLNGIHEEMLALMSVGKAPPTKGVTNGPSGLENSTGEEDEEEEEEEDDEWHRVGPKNKSSVTREANFAKSPISDIFGGQMRSILHQSGSRESATLQPFFTLQLDIQSSGIWNVVDALEHMVSKETLQGYTCSKTKAEVEASRRITLEKLPPVLILHLKRFIYDKSGGCQKMMKRIDYSVDLELGKELFSSTVKGKMSVSQRLYKLFAVVYHLGEEASGGHYITDIFHPSVGGWLRIDDSMVKVVPVSQVLKPTLPRLPYLLFYRQRDL